MQSLSSHDFSRARYLTLILAVVLAITSACAPVSPGATKLAERATSVVGCQNFEDDFWDQLYSYPLEGQSFPSADVMREEFDQAIMGGRLSKLSAADQTRVRDSLTELYQLLALDSVTTLSDDPNHEGKVIEALAAMEMGDRTTPEKDELQTRIRAKLSEISSIMSDSGAPGCAADSPPETSAPGVAESPTPGTHATPATTPTTAETLFSEWKRTRHPAVYGGLKALVTSYQSCEAGMVRPMTSSDSNVSGISITGTHPNGVGSRREITDLQELLRTHFYLKSYRRPSGLNCFGVLQKPMIYDYGGKPYASNLETSSLDFFRNAGSGTSELGIDCSGYVYASLATAGYKLKASGRLKAIGVSGVNSRMYMDPQANGLTCLNYAAFDKTSSIRPGDILASTGHVVLVESVGSDPLGIGHISSVSQCTKANMSISRFNFTILQSSPIKGGIGIDRIRAADYLADGGSMATAMLEHAVNACKAKFQGTITTKSSSANLVRHKGTAECMDTAIRLEREECVASCPASPSIAQDLL